MIVKSSLLRVIPHTPNTSFDTTAVAANVGIRFPLPSPIWPHGMALRLAELMLRWPSSRSATQRWMTADAMASQIVVSLGFLD